MCGTHHAHEGLLWAADTITAGTGTYTHEQGLAGGFTRAWAAGDIAQQAAAMGALQALAVSHMGSPDLQRAWGTADAIPQLCALLRAAALPMRCLAAGALSNFALGCSDATVQPATAPKP